MPKADTNGQNTESELNRVVPQRHVRTTKHQSINAQVQNSVLTPVGQNTKSHRRIKRAKIMDKKTESTQNL